MLPSTKSQHSGGPGAITNNPHLKLSQDQALLLAAKNGGAPGVGLMNQFMYQN
jgi:hypothetical protein